MATYYVTKAGNDTTGDGSEGSPWLTVTHAYPLLIDGDTLLVGDGAYTGGVILDVRVAGTDWVTVQAINPGQVSFYGSGSGFRCSVDPCQWVKFVGLVFTDWACTRFGDIWTALSGWSSNIWFEDCEWELGNHNCEFRNAEYITFKNCYYHDNFTPIQFGISGNSYCRHVLMEDVDVEHNTEYGGGDIDGITAERNSNNNDEDCDFVFRRVRSFLNAAAGFDIKPAGVLFDTCQAYDNGGSGFKKWGINTEFYNCLAYDNYHGWEMDGNDTLLDHCTAYGNRRAVRGNMSDPTTLTIKNSILCSYSAVAPGWIIYTDDGPGSVATDYNVYFCNLDADWLYRQYSPLITLTWADRASWTTKGAHSLLEDPLLGPDYIPAAGSGALGLADDGLNAGWLGVIINSLYDGAREDLLNGDLAWADLSITGLLVSSAYTRQGSHRYLSEVAAGYRLGNPAALSGLSVAAGGIAMADTLRVAGMPSGEPKIAAVILYDDTGEEATSRLLAYINGAIGLPLLPNNSDALVAWPARRVLKL